MTRRAIKKWLRRAEDALREERFADAAGIYDEMLHRFEEETPSLLDHAGVIFGKVRALHGLDYEREAIAVAESAGDLLRIHAGLEKVAA